MAIGNYNNDTKIADILRGNANLTLGELSEILSDAGYSGFGNKGGFRGADNDYYTGMKWGEKRKQIQDDINNARQREIELEQELQDLIDRGASKEEIYEKRKELAYQKRESANLRELQHQNSILGTIGRIVNGVETTVRSIQRMNEPWARADDAASKYAKTIGAIGKGMNALRRDSLQNMVKNHLGINYNISTEELIGLQSDYSRAVGRNIRLSDVEQENLAAVNLAMNGQGNELLAEYEKLGVNLSAASDHIGKLFTTASKEGVSLERYAKNVQQGLAMAQTYTFRGGLRGMEEMAKRAAAVRMEMSQISSFAESFSTIEKALQNSAKLQVLGGPFAAGADALGLLNDSLNGVEDIEKRMENFTASMATFNKTTGEVEVSQFNKMRLRAYAEATGQDYGKVMETVNRQGVVREIEAQIARSSNASGLDKEMQELIKNSGMIKEGKAGITVNGQFKTLDEITAEDRDDLIAETRNQSDDIKAIAKDVRSLVDIRSGFGKQKDSVQATLVSGFARLEKKITAFLGAQNFVLGIILAGQFLGGVSNLASQLFGRGSISKFNPKNWFGRGARGARGGAQGTVTSSASRNAGRLTSARNLSTSTNIARTQSLVNAFGKEGAANVIKTSRAIRGAKGVAETTKAVANGAQAMKGLKFAKAGGVLAGVTEAIATGIDEFGGQKNYGTGKKIGRTAGAATGAGLGGWGGAALGATIGSAILPGIGTAVGGIIGGLAGSLAGGSLGKWIGGGFANQKRREKFREKLGLTEELQGDYSVRQLKEINRAKATGQISKRTLRKLADKGDTAMYQQLNAIRTESQAKKKAERDERRAKREERREKRREDIRKQIGVANFEIGTAYFNGIRSNRGRNLLSNPITNAIKQRINPLQTLRERIPILRGKQERGDSKEMSVFRKLREAARRDRPLDNATNRQGNGPIEVKINGSIKLDYNGKEIDIMKEIKRSPKLMNELAEAVVKSINAQTYGGQKSDRTFGNNIPGVTVG